jgi:hypothetical protein
VEPINRGPPTLLESIPPYALILDLRKLTLELLHSLSSPSPLNLILWVRIWVIPWVSQAIALHRLPRRLGVVREFQSCGDTPESLYYPPLCGYWYWRTKAKSLWPVWWGERIERDPILCGFLNGDVCTFVVLNFRIKYCVFSCSCCLLSSSYLVLVFHIASFVTRQNILFLACFLV